MNPFPTRNENARTMALLPRHRKKGSILRGGGQCSRREFKDPGKKAKKAGKRGHAAYAFSPGGGGGLCLVTITKSQFSRHSFTRTRTPNERERAITCDRV